MKFGIRKPSLKKSISARTTGKAKRKLKRLVNPFYGKKGMGLITNPKKSIYNRVYRRTTVSAKGAAGCLTACIYYPIVFSFLAMWWILKYSVLGILWIGTALVNSFIALVELLINIGHEEECTILESADTVKALPIHNEIVAYIAPTEIQSRVDSSARSMAYPEIRNQIFKILEDNPGIVQTEVYKKFAPAEKDKVSQTLYWLAQEQQIERVKSGRTYQITIK